MGKGLKCNRLENVGRRNGRVLCISFLTEAVYYYFLTPVLNSQGMKKITLCNTKKYKHQTGMNLTPPPPSRNSHVVRWHCTAESEQKVAEIKVIIIIIFFVPKLSRDRYFDRRAVYSNWRCIRRHATPPMPPEISSRLRTLGGRQDIKEAADIYLSTMTPRRGVFIAYLSRLLTHHVRRYSPIRIMWGKWSLMP